MSCFAHIFYTVFSIYFAHIFCMCMWYSKGILKTVVFHPSIVISALKSRQSDAPYINCNDGRLQHWLWYIQYLGVSSFNQNISFHLLVEHFFFFIYAFHHLWCNFARVNLACVRHFWRDANWRIYKMCIIIIITHNCGGHGNFYDERFPSLEILFAYRLKFMMCFSFVWHISMLQYFPIECMQRVWNVNLPFILKIGSVSRAELKFIVN